MHTWHIRRSAWIIALALAAALPASVAFGIAKIGSVRIAGGADGSDAGEVYTAAEGTKSVFARFDYTGASRTDITVRVIANSLMVFEQTKSYTGDDTASVEITGQTVYKTALATMSTYSAQLIREVNGLTGSNDLVGGEALQYITSIEGAKNQIEIGLPLLASLALDGPSDRAFNSLSGDLEDIATTIAAAQALPADDTSGRQEFGREIKPIAERVDGSLDDLAVFIDDIADVALPATGTDWNFDVSVRTTTSSGSSTAGSARFMVTGKVAKSEDEPDEATARPSSTSRSGVGDDTERGGATPTPRAQRTVASNVAPGASNSATAPTARAGAVGQPPASDGRDTSALRTPDNATGSSDAPEGAAGMDDPNAMVEDADAAQIAMAPGAQPTWTVPAGRAADASNSSPIDVTETPDASSSGPGPNVMILGLGLALLVGAALWFRRRA